MNGSTTTSTMDLPEGTKVAGGRGMTSALGALGSCRGVGDLNNLLAGRVPEFNSGVRKRLLGTSAGQLSWLDAAQAGSLSNGLPAV